MKNRKRSVDIYKLEPAQVDSLSMQLGDKINQICDGALGEINKVLNIYGLQATMSLSIDTVQKEEQKANAE